MMVLRELKTEEKPCLICNRKTIDELRYGPLIEKNGIVVHHYCLLFNSSIEQNGKDDDGIFGFLERDIMDALRNIQKNCCCYCSGRMASVTCSKSNCSAVFHYPCGVENGSMHQFTGRFNSFCFAHRPRQRIVGKVQVNARENPPVCLICLEIVDWSNVGDVIWASCCRFTWYHRDCLQAYALSSGYLFQCATCRDRIKFKNLVKRFGIYVPKRDASWETSPGAYQELYARNRHCDIGDCKCPLGRTHEDDEDWQLLMCCSCGSQGVHIECSDLAEGAWECETCREVR